MDGRKRYSSNSALGRGVASLSHRLKVQIWQMKNLSVTEGEWLLFPTELEQIMSALFSPSLFPIVIIIVSSSHFYSHVYEELR